MAHSSTVIAGINFSAMLLFIPVTSAGIWLATQTDNSCVNLLQWPVIAIGIFAFFVGLSGFVGAIWRLPSLLLFYLAAMLVEILVLAGLVIFIFVVAGSGSGRAVPNRVYREYRLEDYSGWLSGRVEGPEKWARIRACLSSTTICSELNQTYRLPQDFFYARLSPLQVSAPKQEAELFLNFQTFNYYTYQSGCCKPPTECGHTFVDPTYWISPISSATNADCDQWSNDQTRLCYSCDSCKAGVLGNLSREWRRVDLILLFILIALICLYVAGCYIYRSDRTDKLFSRHKQGYYF